MNKINNTSITLKNKGEIVTLFGFVANKRKMGELIFIDLRDRSGIIQLVIRKKINEFAKESVLKVVGEVVERKNKNPKLKTGDIEINVSSLEVLSNAQYELPFVIRDDLDAKEDTRLKHRYLDLRRPQMQKIIRTRHKIIKAIRDFLDSKDFYEIETPLLSKSTPEGARDFLVPTRSKGKFFALPQSPQLYKQLLMISGFEKYFQITKVFRDEDSRKDRQPEFTQLDIELSYANEEILKQLIEEMYKSVFASIGIKLVSPFARMDFDYAIKNYGTDKPDTRYKYLLVDVKKDFSNSEFNSFKLNEAVKMIAFDQVLSKKEIKILNEESKKNGAKGLMFVSLKDGQMDGPGKKFFTSEAKMLFAQESLTKGTLLFVADAQQIVNQSLGAIRVKLNEMFNLANDEYKFVWIINWPLYEKDHATNKMVPAHHPFTMPAKESFSNFDINKEEAKARSYDLILNGFELGSGSVRINDIAIQKRMFQAIGMNEEEQNAKFGFFLEAFKYGVPPHLGIAFGIDRLIMILEKTKSIRDVIAFPKNAAYIAPMEGTPSSIDDNYLNN